MLVGTMNVHVHNLVSFTMVLWPWLVFLFTLMIGPVYGFVVPTRTNKAAALLSSSSTHRSSSSSSSWTRIHLSPIPASHTAITVAPAAAKVVTNKIIKKSIVKGKLTGFLSKFMISPYQAAHIAKRLVLTIKKDFVDLVLIVSVYHFIIPLAYKIYQRRNLVVDMDPDRLATRFQRSKTHRLAKAMQEVSFLWGLLYGFDIGLVLLDELGFEFVKHYPVYQWTAGIVASLWASRNLSEFKDFVLTRGNRIDLRQSPGRRLLSRFMDILIYGGTALVILDFLSVQTGFALKSLFGLSSVGTLVFSLASKELVSEFLASLAIQGTNMYSEGERILLSDGTTGTVQKLGWLNTHLRRGDELVVRIPNTQISGTRVANISRSRLSTVKQALAISYDDIDKLPQLIEDIKKEIRESCPTLIDDGSRSFQVFFTDYKEYSVEVLVSAHFRTKPFCDAYYEVKQDVLMAIRRATIKNKVKFSYVNFLQSTVPFLE